MCGIIGFSSKKNYSFNKIQTLTLCNSYERGGDATGFYTPTTGIIKDITNAHNFIKKGLSAKLKPDSTLIAHVRKSSVGANNKVNAHPFENNGIVLCHNGTLTSYIKLANNYNIPHNEYFTDSQVLAKAISKEISDNNQEELNDIPSVLYKYEGAAALLWYDSNTKIMYAYRDDSRPLYYGIVNNSMYISSLEYALEIIGCKNVKLFNSFTLYCIKEGKIVKTLAKKQSDFYKLGSDSDFKVWNFGTLYKSNTEFTGIKNEVKSIEYLKGFRLIYKDISINCKSNTYYENNEWLASLTKNKRYKILDVKNSFFCIEDDNLIVKKVSYTCFDIKNVFPIVGRYCTVNGKIVKSNTDIEVIQPGDILKVISYNFTDLYFKATVLKSNENYTIPIGSFLPYTEEEYSDVCKVLGDDSKSLKSEEVEIIEEDVPWSENNNFEESESDGANWVHFDDVETYIDLVSSKIEDIMDKYGRSEDIEHNLDDLYSTVVDAYNKTKFEELINEEK